MPANFWWSPMEVIAPPPPGGPDFPPIGGTPGPTITGDLLSTTANNWMMGPGIPHARWTRAPGTSDDLFFMGTPEGNHNCVVPVGVTTVVPSAAGTPPQAPSQNTYAGIHTVNGYSKTVTLQKSLSVGTLEMTSGVIRQDAQTSGNSNGLPGGPPSSNSLTAYAGNLWITSSLNWTGGTLNDNSVGGSIFLSGATGTTNPIAAPNITLNLGSALTLMANSAGVGSSLRVLSGTYDLYNNAKMEIREKCDVKYELKLLTGILLNDRALNTTTDAAIDVRDGGQATFFLSPNTPRPTGNTDTAAPFRSLKPIRNRGGTILVKDRVEVEINTLLGQSILDPAGKATSFLQQAATDPQKFASTTQIEAGSRLVTVLDPIYVGSGSFEVLALPGAGNAQPEAYIGGSTTALRLAGGRLVMPSTSEFGKLKIDGDVVWSGGSISLALSATTQDVSDKIAVAGKVTITNTPDLVLRWKEPQMKAAPKFWTWILITSSVENGITGGYKTVLNQGDPTVVTMDVTTNGTKQKIQAQKTNDPV